MKTYYNKTHVRAARIKCVNNDTVITEDMDAMQVGHDWLTTHAPRVGDWITHRGGALIRADDFARDYDTTDPLDDTVDAELDSSVTDSHSTPDDDLQLPSEG